MGRECGEECVVVGVGCCCDGERALVVPAALGLLPGDACVPRKFLRMGKSAMDASIICVNRSSANLAATMFPRQSWSSRSRRPLFTSSWMSRTVRFTGKGMPSRETTG